jgi:hypothetical protein
MNELRQRPKDVVIDADFMLYTVGFSCESSTEREALNRLTEWITDIVYMKLDCESFRAYLTPKHNYRYDIAKTVGYKSNRIDSQKPKHFDALRKHLTKMGAVEVEGIEADDAVAIESAKHLDNIWIVHVDKDLNQLQGWHYNPTKDEEYYVTEFEGFYSFYKQLLTGDRVDAIPGLAGIGPKKAEKILKDCKTEDELHRAAFQAYQDKGHDMVYYTEQGQLLWLQRYEGELWQPQKGS